MGLARSMLIINPGQFRYPAVQRYLHDLSTDLGEHIESITSALSLFIEVGKCSISRPFWTSGFLIRMLQVSPRFGSRRNMAHRTCSTSRPSRLSSLQSPLPACSSRSAIPTISLQMPSTHSGSRRWCSVSVSSRLLRRECPLLIIPSSCCC